MKATYLLFLSLFLLSCQSSGSSTNEEKERQTETSIQKFETTGSIERLDPSIDQLIKKDAQIEVLEGGFTWTEGPLWIEDGNYLLFSDIPPNSIFKWSEEEGLSLYLKPSGYTGEKERDGEPGSNGLLLDANGNLVLCQHGDRQIGRMAASLSDPKPNYETIIGQYEGKRFNSPNDAVYDIAGNLYFTDPPYGLEQRMQDPTKEIDFQGVYRYSKDGALTLITDQMSRPNGIGLSPDGKTLYVANSDLGRAIWMAFSLNEDGSVASEKVFYDATGSKDKGAPDGLKVDKKGNVWATGPGGVWVFSPEGKVLGKIKTGQATSNCAFNADQSILYMTCDDYLYRIKLM